MNLLVIRHAVAEDKDDFAKTGQTDDARPLTSAGVKKMQRNVRGLRKVVSRIDLLASSTLKRARQTADIIAAGYEKVPRTDVAQLSPGTPPRDLLLWVAKQKAKTVAIVGHEPDLSRFIAYALARRTRPMCEMKKGAACMLSLDGHGTRARATLLWFLTPGQLRKID